MIRLFLNNIEVELNSSVQFAINKQFEDITSPADIKNDWSKTVQIPFTQSNNKLFGELFNVDRLIVEGDSKLMGIYFDPYKKVDFRLQWGDAIIMQGYAKNIDVVKSANGEGHYNITLNGELGKVFQEMKKITFDKTTEDTNYLIDGSKYVSETIDKDLVYKLWTTEPDLEDLTLYETSDTNYKVEDVLGFSPNNSFNEDFDYKTYQINSTSSELFKEELDSKAKSIGGASATYESVVGISSETVVGNGLLPRAIGEFRSYLQLPYIYFNKLFTILLEKTKQITGYNYELDSSWFNSSNPYWGRLVYMLKQFNNKEETESFEDTTGVIELQNCNLRSGTTDVPVRTYPYTYSPSTLDRQWVEFSGLRYIDELKSKFESGDIDKIIINEEIPIDIIITNPKNKNGEEVGSSSDFLVMGKGANIVVIFAVYDENDNLVSSHTTAICGTQYTANNLGNPEMVFKIDKIPNVGGRVWKTTAKGKMVFLIDRNTVGSTFTIKISAQYVVVPTDGEMLSQYIEPVYFLNSIDSRWNNIVVGSNVKTTIPYGSKITYTTSDIIKRSGGNFTLNDLWDNEFNLFNEVLDYCKMFRIGVFCDDINKKLIFKPLSKYFSEYSILDWTDKLDMSKEYHIQPITFEDKYLLFNYNGIDTQLNKDYAEKYGVKYGEYKLVTEYEFNNETKKLYDGIYNSIPSTEAVLSWGKIYDELAIVYIIPAEILPNNLDKDKKCMDIFGSFFIYNGLADWDTNSGLRSVKITDDTSLQIINNLYFYTQDAEGNKNKISVPTYPLLDIKANDNNICVFTTPTENYTYRKDNYNNTKGIYKNFWENYLNERYNKQNKIVTCYLRLSPYDIANFQYNNFVNIENQLYMVNKIYDYQIDENISTKVDLITIQDVSGYYANNFNVHLYITDVNGLKYNMYDNINMVNDDLTVYVTSDTNVNIDVDIISGNPNNAAINEATIDEVLHGYDVFSKIPMGSMQPLRIHTTDTGDDFKIKITLTDTLGYTFTFYVSCVW